MVVVSGMVVRVYECGGAVYGLCVRSSEGWGRCGQVSGSGIHTGRKAPGKLGVVEAET